MSGLPALFHSGFGVIAAISVLGVLASMLTLVASLLILWRYRRSVARLMASTGGAGSYAPAASLVTPGAVTVAGDTAESLHRALAAQARRLTYVYVAAGALFALTLAACSVAAFSQIQINPLRAAAHPLFFLFLAGTFAWPIVMTVNRVALVSRAAQWLMVLGYAVVLAVLGALVALTPTEAAVDLGGAALPAWHGESPLRLFGKWALFNLIPTLLSVLFGTRRLRAVAPLVLGFMTLLSAGVLGMLTAAYVHQAAAVAALVGVFDTTAPAVAAAYYLVLLAAAVALSGALGWRLLAWLRRAYLRKSVSDQSLAVDALWLVFAAYYAVILAWAGPGWALAPLLGFGVLRLGVWAGQCRIQPAEGADAHAPTLLVLRVFALGRRSEILFDAVTRQWRHAGNVLMIAGTDLAQSTVAPHRLLAFVSGNLPGLFIRDGAALEHAIAAVDVGRDADGRFRINDFFCHADTWQLVLSRLIGRADAVLMDLRSFCASNAGCIYEINALLNAMPLAQLVLVVDDSTDLPFLEQTLQACLRDLPPASPNAGLALSALRLFDLRAVRQREVTRLTQNICAAAVLKK